MRILFIGAGSLGSLFGTKLALSGNIIEVIDPLRSTVKKHEYRIKLETTEQTVLPVPNFYIIPPIKNWDKEMVETIPQILIISTKAYSLPYIIEEYRQIFHNKNLSAIILLQNGIGNEDLFRDSGIKTPLYRLISSNGAFLKSLDHIIHTGKGPTYLCPYIENYSDDTKNLVEKEFLNELNKAGLNPQISNNPEKTIWEKALINIGINSFGALTRLKNGELNTSYEIKEIIKKTLKEAIYIAKRLRISLDFSKDYAKDVFSVCEATSLNYNSMLQDILNKRKTEIDFLNGKIVEYGKEFEKSTPYNETLTVLIKGIEKSYEKN